ncbi:CamS family sex pheromone protein [Ornithinibacillus sp. 4-3]|uniref:CamS family sex pheromone protein n=1 Tax=Ornithinibacillus sp. 4-3 TaxID=3231488 RepID=A0AB39HPU9_9BACI
MKKKICILLLGALLMLTSCIQKPENDILQTEDGTDQEVSIVPNYKLSEENYRMILPYRPSRARGVIVNQMTNRMDINEIETGLRRLSTSVFDPEQYYFEEGQNLGESLIYQWLGRQLTEEQLEQAVDNEISRLKREQRTVNEDAIRAELQAGLNPPIENNQDEDEQRGNPRYVSHILEHNFLEKKDDDSITLRGISLAIALKSVYRFQTETGGPYLYEKLPDNEVMSQGKEIAQTVLERVRAMEGLENIPIMIALYKEQEQGSPIPGNFIAMTTVSGNENQIEGWEDVNEKNVLFPSDEAKEDHVDDSEVLQSFGQDIAEYFPNYVGYIGQGFYVDDNLRKLTIEIPLEFYSAGEIIGFTQYVYGVVLKNFSDSFDLEIKITSSNQVESFIYREAGQEEPTVHVFH